MGSSFRLKLTTILVLILVAGLALFGTIRFTTHAAGISHNGSPSSSVYSHSQTVTCGHWNIVPSPNEPSANNFLIGVAALSPNDAWAVGNIIEHWDGTTWSIVPNPVGYGYLSGVTALSTNDVWAVGEYNSSKGGISTLVEHWDGTSWSVVPGWNTWRQNNVLYAVTQVPGTKHLWAVGDSYTWRKSFTPALIEDWNGTSWGEGPKENPGLYNHLYGVTAIARDNIWAVGSFSNALGSSQAFIEHGGTKGFGVVSTINIAPNNTLGGITQVPGTNQLWAVGQAGGTLIAFYC